MAKDIHKIVRETYGKVAEKGPSCCGPNVQPCCEPVEQSCCESAAASCCGDGSASTVVARADMGLSCGNPIMLAEVAPGETVLDLGSGAGRDVFPAAGKVGPEGRVIGVDMTPEMLARARENLARFRDETGLDNVEFREGLIEGLPVEDASVDLVISNCVINLSPDKRQVFREVARVLKPGGRLVVSDIVLNRELPKSTRDDESLLCACIGGASLRQDYLAAIQSAGLERIEILTDSTYRDGADVQSPVASEPAADLEGCAASITVRAFKPAD